MTKAKIKTLQEVYQGAERKRGRPKLLVVVLPPRIDWSQVMIDLYNSGVCAHRVSKLIGSSHAAAMNWEKGGEPGHAYGVALLRLHASFCGAALTTRRQVEAERTTSSSANAMRV